MKTHATVDVRVRKLKKTDHLNLKVLALKRGMTLEHLVARIIKEYVDTHEE